MATTILLTFGLVIITAPTPINPTTVGISLVISVLGIALRYYDEVLRRFKKGLPWCIKMLIACLVLATFVAGIITGGWLLG